MWTLSFGRLTPETHVPTTISSAFEHVPALCYDAARVVKQCTIVTSRILKTTAIFDYSKISDFFVKTQIFQLTFTSRLLHNIFILKMMK